MWVKLWGPSPVCSNALHQNNLYSPSEAQSIAKYFWEPLSNIFSCLPAPSQHPVQAEPPSNTPQHDFIAFSLINLCRKPKAVPAPGARSLAGNPNVTERSSLTVVMKPRQNQKLWTFLLPLEPSASTEYTQSCQQCFSSFGTQTKQSSQSNCLPDHYIKFYFHSQSWSATDYIMKFIREEKIAVSSLMELSGAIAE